jgi:hypothetical protein
MTSDAAVCCLLLSAQTASFARSENLFVLFICPLGSWALAVLSQRRRLSHTGN